MDRNEIENKIKSIVAAKLNIPPEKITPGAQLREDLGMDSFAAVEVVFEIEDGFNITVGQEDVPGIITFSDMVEYVAQRITVK